MRTKQTKINFFKWLSAWASTLALIVGLLPATTFAAGNLTSLYIQTDDGSYTDVLDSEYKQSDGTYKIEFSHFHAAGRGYAQFYPSTNTLELYHVNMYVNGNNAGIEATFNSYSTSNTLNIVLTGSSRIDLQRKPGTTGIQCMNGNLNISAGSLTIIAGSRGIHCTGSLTVNGASITTYVFDDNSYGIRAENGGITIKDGASIDIEAVNVGMSAYDNVSINNSEFIGLVSGSNTERHVICSSGDITINNSRVEAEMTDTSATSNTDAPDDKSYTIQAGDALTIENSIVTATSANNEWGLWKHPIRSVSIKNSWVVCSAGLGSPFDQFGGTSNTSNNNSVLVDGSNVQRLGDFMSNYTGSYHRIELPQGAVMEIGDDGGTITGDTFTIPDNITFWNYGTINVLNNGTLKALDPVFNYGTITVKDGGKLDVQHNFYNGYDGNEGTITVEAGGTLEINYGQAQVNGHHFENNGTVTLAQGSIFTKDSSGANTITCADGKHIGNATCASAAECEFCGQSYSAPHSLTKIDKVAATCEATGTEAYWTCKVCNKKFSDEAGMTEIQNADVIPVTGHSWGDWTSDNNDKTHSHTCSECEAIETEDCSGGTATYYEKAKCSVCGGSYGELKANPLDDVKDITDATLSKDDKGALEDAVAAVEQEIQNNETGYNADQLEELENKLAELEKKIETIENAEQAESGISALPDTVSPDDTATEEEINSAKDVYNNLTDGEKALVSEELKNKLESLQEQLVDYRITEGSGSTWTKETDGEGQTFVANGAVSKFEGVEVDGAAVDQANYTVKSGSTIVTLKQEYLDTLAVGNHTIKLNYTDGSVDGTFIVVEKTSAPTGDGQTGGGQTGGEQTGGEQTGDKDNPDTGKTDIPQTGDNSNIALWIALALASGAALMGTTLYSRRKKCSR